MNPHRVDIVRSDGRRLTVIASDLHWPSVIAAYEAKCAKWDAAKEPV